MMRAKADQGWVQGLLVLVSLFMFIGIMAFWFYIPGLIDAPSEIATASSEVESDVPLFARIGLPICAILFLSAFSISKQSVILPLLSLPCLFFIVGFVFWLAHDAMMNDSGAFALFFFWTLASAPIALIYMLCVWLKPNLRAWASKQ